MSKIGTYQLPDGVELTDKQVGVWRDATFVPDPEFEVVEFTGRTNKADPIMGKVEKVLTIARPYSGAFANMPQPDVIVLDGVEYRAAAEIETRLQLTNDALDTALQPWSGAARVRGDKLVAENRELLKGK